MERHRRANKLCCMERLIIILLLLLFNNTATSQLNPITKKELKTLIKHGITNKNYCWEICNDSVSFKNDSITVNISQSYSCGNFTLWEFRSNREIWESKTKREIYTTSSDWKEYTFETTPVTPSCIFKIKIRYKDNKLLLERYNNSKLENSYHVAGYTKEDNTKASLLLIKQ